MKKIRIVVVGLNFGSSFVPIYQKHPYVQSVGACDADPQRLEQIKASYGVQRLHTDLAEVLAGRDYDAVHLLTPVTTHGDLALEVMKSGKHCASAVPMGLKLAELDLKQAKAPADFPACVGRRTAAGVGYLPRGRSIVEVVVGSC